MQKLREVALKEPPAANKHHQSRLGVAQMLQNARKYELEHGM